VAREERAADARSRYASGMHVFVTGATGLVGRALCHALLA
jgi:FlaA1/EpsC-like NDP-sugar epimerase